MVHRRPVAVNKRVAGGPHSMGSLSGWLDRIATGRYLHRKRLKDCSCQSAILLASRLSGRGGARANSELALDAPKMHLDRLSRHHRAGLPRGFLPTCGSLAAWSSGGFSSLGSHKSGGNDRGPRILHPRRCQFRSGTSCPWSRAETVEDFEGAFYWHCHSHKPRLANGSVDRDPAHEAQWLACRSARASYSPPSVEAWLEGQSDRRHISARRST
jgi:hypothetical protein